MSTETPAPKPVGRPLSGKAARQIVGASVSSETKQLLAAWCALLQMTIPAAHVGNVLDQLAEFGKRNAFAKSLKQKGPAPFRGNRATKSSDAN